MHTTIYKIGKQQARMVQGTILNILQQPIKEKNLKKNMYIYATSALTIIHSSLHGHLGCFHVLAIINSAAMNIGVHLSFQIKSFLQIYATSGIAKISLIPKYVEDGPLLLSS